MLVSTFNRITLCYLDPSFHVTFADNQEPHLMAEVIRYWPPVRNKATREMSYPWDDWMDGNIWLAQQGVDFPKTQHPVNFRNTLYTKAAVVSKARLLALKKRTVRPKSIRFLPTHVKVRIISESQVAFQFYEGHEAPEEPIPIKASIPTRKVKARA